jgi:hypothetical protein
MTTALSATSSYCITKHSNNPHGTMENDAPLNAFYEGLLDENGYLGDDDNYIDDDGTVDDDKRSRRQQMRGRETLC